MTELVERARARGARLLRRLPGRVRRDLHAERDRRAAARRRGLPVRPGDRFLLTFDNHNSVNGIREFARARGAETTYVPSVRARPPRRRGAALPRYLDRRRAATTTTCSPTRRSRTSPASSTRSTGSTRRTTHGWDVLLDAAAFVPTQPARPLTARTRTSSCLSFYKMFGWPTGVGALIARREALAKLRAALVLRRHDRRRLRAARVVPVRARRGPLRGRHRQLPQPPRRRDRAPLPRPHRHRRASTRTSNARRPAARRARPLCAMRNGAPAASVYGPRRRRPPRRDDRLQLPPPRRPNRRRALRRPRWRTALRSRSAPAASATRAPARSPSPSRAKRWSAASSAKA